MLRNLLMLAAAVCLVLLGIHWLLQVSNLTTYAERLPGADTAPMIDYFAGQIYYNVENYDTAAGYFKYVTDRFPSSAYTERANAFWLECRVHQLTKSPAEALAQCRAFLERYPNSAYTQRVQKLEDIFQQSMMH